MVQNFVFMLLCLVLFVGELVHAYTLDICSRWKCAAPLVRLVLEGPSEGYDTNYPVNSSPSAPYGLLQVQSSIISSQEFGYQLSSKVDSSTDPSECLALCIDPSLHAYYFSNISLSVRFGYGLSTSGSFNVILNDTSLLNHSWSTGIHGFTYTLSFSYPFGPDDFYSGTVIPSHRLEYTSDCPLDTYKAVLSSTDNGSTDIGNSTLEATHLSYGLDGSLVSSNTLPSSFHCFGPGTYSFSLPVNTSLSLNNTILSISPSDIVYIPYNDSYTNTQTNSTISSFNDSVFLLPSLISNTSCPSNNIHLLTYITPSPLYSNIMWSIHSNSSTTNSTLLYTFSSLGTSLCLPSSRSYRLEILSLNGSPWSDLEGEGGYTGFGGFFTWLDSVFQGDAMLIYDYDHADEGDPELSSTFWGFTISPPLGDLVAREREIFFDQEMSLLLPGCSLILQVFVEGEDSTVFLSLSEDNDSYSSTETYRPEIDTFLSCLEIDKQWTLSVRFPNDESPPYSISLTHTNSSGTEISTWTSDSSEELGAVFNISKNQGAYTIERVSRCSLESSSLNITLYEGGAPLSNQVRVIPILFGFDGLDQTVGRDRILFQGATCISPGVYQIEVDNGVDGVYLQIGDDTFLNSNSSTYLVLFQNKTSSLLNEPEIDQVFLSQQEEANCTSNEVSLVVSAVAPEYCHSLVWTVVKQGGGLVYQGGHSGGSICLPKGSVYQVWAYQYTQESLDSDIGYSGYIVWLEGDIVSYDFNGDIALLSLGLDNASIAIEEGEYTRDWKTSTMLWMGEVMEDIPEEEDEDEDEEEEDDDDNSSSSSSSSSSSDGLALTLGISLSVLVVVVLVSGILFLKLRKVDRGDREGRRVSSLDSSRRFSILALLSRRASVVDDVV